MRPLVLIGHVAHPRVEAFQRALADEGLPPAVIVPWRSMVRGRAALARALRGEPGAIVRIDSPGQDYAVTRAFLRRGYAQAVAEGVSVVHPEAVRRRPRYGRVLAPRQRHLGLLDVLDQVAEVVGQVRVVPPPAEIAELYDKRRTSRRYAAAGLPVPTALEGVDSLDVLRARLAELRGQRVFVKLASGSSGTGIAVCTLDDRGRLVAHTTLRREGDGLYNTRAARRYDEPADLDATVGFLLREGAQVEVEVPKARVGGAPFDLRVLTIAGEPALVVGRAARDGGPITNLHLGGERVDAEDVRHTLGADGWEALHDTARRVAALHPGCLQLGVDVVVGPGGQGTWVLEANAFGDWLPGLVRGGLDAHRLQIRALRETVTGL